MIILIQCACPVFFYLAVVKNWIAFFEYKFVTVRCQNKTIWCNIHVEHLCLQYCSQYLLYTYALSNLYVLDTALDLNSLHHTQVNMKLLRVVPVWIIQDEQWCSSIILPLIRIAVVWHNWHRPALISLARFSTEDGDAKEFYRRRVVEIKHGRVSMLACTGSSAWYDSNRCRWF